MAPLTSRRNLNGHKKTKSKLIKNEARHVPFKKLQTGTESATIQSSNGNGQSMPNQHDSLHLDEKLQRANEQLDQAMRENKKLEEEWRHWEELLGGYESQTQLQKLIERAKEHEKVLDWWIINRAMVENDEIDASNSLK